jgi:hypothetical protein
MRDDHVGGVSGQVRLQVGDRPRDEAVWRERAREALIGEDDLECARIEAGDPTVGCRDVGSIPIQDFFQKHPVGRRRTTNESRTLNQSHPAKTIR